MDASYGEIFESAAKYFPKGADIEALKNLDAILTLIQAQIQEKIPQQMNSYPKFEQPKKPEPELDLYEQLMAEDNSRTMDLIKILQQ